MKEEKILKLLNELKGFGEVFNKMGGYLYSSICADEMNKIFNKLKDEYGVEVKYYQSMPGRVTFTNIDELISKYTNNEC